MITSTSNARIKQIRKLRDRKERDRSGLFYIEGLRIVGEAFEQNASIDTLLYSPELLTSKFGQQLIDQAGENNISLLEVGAKVFKSLSSKDGPQGIAAIVRQNALPLSEITIRKGQFWVALDAVQDPGNLGTILRTADSVGAQGVIVLDHSTDPYSITAIRASMGALFSQKIVRSEYGAFKAWVTENAYPVVGTSDSAELDYQEYDYPQPLILLMGSEREGLHQKYYPLCSEIVRIPMVGKSDSLNLSIATGVMLYEIFNQYRKRMV